MKPTHLVLLALAVLFLQANPAKAQTVTFDSFDNCALWTGVREGWVAPAPPQFTATTNCGSSKINLVGNQSNISYVKSHAYGTYNFVSGTKYIVTASIRAFFSFSGYQFGISATNAFGSMGQSIGFTSSGTTQNTYTTVSFVFIPNSNYSVLVLTGRAMNAPGWTWTGLPPSVEVDYVQITESPCQGTAASISGSDVCQNEWSRLTASPGLAYLWSNQTMASTTDVLETIEGTYSYNVYVLDASGCLQFASKTITVKPVPSKPTISPAGVPSSSVIDLYSCQGNPLIFTSSSAFSYQWLLRPRNAVGSGYINLGTSQTQLLNLNAGQFEVSVRAIGANGCSALGGGVELLVVGNPTVSISGQSQICPGGSTTLTATAGLTYLWSNGATTQSITVSIPGTYSVIGTNQFGCSTTSPALTVSISQPTPPTITVSQRCDYTILASNSASSYLWSTGATGSYINVYAPGTYSLRVGNSLGCISESTSVNATIRNPNSSVGSISQSGNFCAYGAVFLTAGPGTNYSWGQQTIVVYAEGDYEVSYYDVYDCFVTATTTVFGCAPDGGCTVCPRKSINGVDLVEDEDLTANHVFGISPNPTTTSEVLIVLTEAAKADCPLFVIDMQGRIQVQDLIEIGKREKYIRLGDISDGIYFVQIQDNKRTRFRKLVVQRE